MSRTIAHTPSVFARHNGAVEVSLHHDHSSGDCRMETIQDVKGRYGPKSPRYQRGTMGLHYEVPCRPEINCKDWNKLGANHPPKVYIKIGFTKPARQRARRDLRLAKREHNTYGETDTQPEPYLPRHGAVWYWD